MKIATFNIRCDYGQDGDNNFRYRKPLILEKLAEEKPDIVCFQEVLPHVAAGLKGALTGYYGIGCGRSETLEDEQAAIAYRRDAFNLIQMETYWLSDTPYVPASRYPDQSICPRVTTEAVFEELATKRVFRVVNTHLDHEGAGAREQGMRQIMEKLGRAALFADAPVVITGDMNDSTEKKLVKKYGLPDVEVLLAGHHGSRYSTSQELLEAVTPEMGIISVGQNRFGHPTQEAMDRMIQAGMKLRRTDEEGNILIQVGK